MKLFKALLVIAIVLSCNVFAQEKDTNPCKEDREKLCATCKPGEKDCVKACIEKNEENLSAKCKADRAAKKVEKK